MTPQQIEALKMALDLATMHHTDNGYAALREKVRSASKEALAEHAMRETQRLRQEIEQEPVAWATREDFYRELDRSVNRMRQQMEIKGVVMRYADYDIALPVIDIRDGHVLVGQVTTPPQRKPLTDEAISNIWCKVSNTDFVTVDTHEFARAIEAAHGIWPENSDCYGPDWTDRDGEYLK